VQGALEGGKHAGNCKNMKCEQFSQMTQEYNYLDIAILSFVIKEEKNLEIIHGYQLYC
jgi:hypothetical protein